MDLENFKKIVLCALHVGQLHDPVVLKCQDAFCRTCILKYVKDCEKTQREKECPTCAKIIHYTLEELSTLAPSLFHKNLIQTINAQQLREHDRDDLIHNEIKVSLLGSSSCGKSSLMRCLSGLPFNDRLNYTIGVDFITVNVRDTNHLTKIHLWDTAGQELYRTMIRYYYRNSKGIILVYDITNESSFNDIETWLEQIKQNCDVQDDELVILLIGNKLDLSEQRVVTNERARQFANRNNLLYYETSAKTGENVNEALARLVAKVNSFIEFSQHREYNSPNTILLNSSRDYASSSRASSTCYYCSS